MRRLAKQDRDDTYATRRDYQQIEKVPSDRLLIDGSIERIRFTANLKTTGDDLCGFGAYFRAPVDTRAIFTLDAGGDEYKFEAHLGPEWSRVGLGFELSQDYAITVDMVLQPAPPYVDAWGVVIGKANFPSLKGGSAPPLPELNVTHLLPETLFLAHDRGPWAQIKGAKVAVEDGGAIEVKKCSYCGRQLPLGPGQAGRLAFHKHNAKISGHQNECRACKKWRINDEFNPLRTVDQLNESSIITRERKILLHEPLILQTIKERQGRGLKSIVWDRFGRRCFYCEKPLKLQEVQLDHTRPLSYLWPIDEHATCLCAEHNNEKKDKFPVDFYNGSQLRRLSEITGLSVEKLSAREVCEPQLQRIRRDISKFARGCDPRTFNAIARKVIEVRPDVDLWNELAQADSEAYASVKEAQALRPASVGEVEYFAEMLRALEDE